MSEAQNESNQLFDCPKVFSETSRGSTVHIKHICSLRQYYRSTGLILYCLLVCATLSNSFIKDQGERKQYYRDFPKIWAFSK